MVGKKEVIENALECGFEDTGFTTAAPFETQRAYLEERREDYEWAIRSGLDLIAGTDPKSIFPEAKSIIVIMEAYFREAFPPSLERHERVKSMTAWALGRIGGPAAKQAFSDFLAESAGPVRSEILSALKGVSPPGDA
ncbi:MAG: hypothetical protein ABIJ25_11915 [Pseudomonadota bacterium]